MNEGIELTTGTPCGEKKNTSAACTQMKIYRKFNGIELEKQGGWYGQNWISSEKKEPDYDIWVIIKYHRVSKREAKTRNFPLK